VGDEGTRAKHPSLKRGEEFRPSYRPRYITEAEEWEMRDLEAKHPSLKRGGEFSPSCRPRYNRG
jgi:hypothetical protein